MNDHRPFTACSDAATQFRSAAECSERAATIHAEVHGGNKHTRI